MMTIGVILLALLFCFGLAASSPAWHNDYRDDPEYQKLVDERWED